MSKDFLDAVEKYGAKGKPKGWKPSLEKKVNICQKHGIISYYENTCPLCLDEAEKAIKEELSDVI